MKLTIKGELCDLNNYIASLNNNRYGGNDVKQGQTEIVYVECLSQRIRVKSESIFLKITWYCKDKRKDKDNIAFAKKFIFDGLVMAGVIKNDGWKQIAGWDDDNFEVDKNNPRVEIQIIEV